MKLTITKDNGTVLVKEFDESLVEQAKSFGGQSMKETQSLKDKEV